MGIPIFFIHKGNSFYLKYSILQAKYQNPESKVYLLGDKSNKYDFVEHYLICDYITDEFKKVYKHLSANDYNYELFCFERWFILRDFIKKMKIENPFIYLDSDVMTYCNYTKQFENDKNINMTICSKIGPEYSYFKTIHILSDYCNFLIDSYSNPLGLFELEKEYNEYQQSKEYIGGGICDMRLLKKYTDTIKNYVLDINYISQNNEYFDHNITNSDGFIFDKFRGIKIIKFIKGIPYLIQNSSQKKVHLLATHFQGGSKYYMPKYYTGKYNIKLLFVYIIDTIYVIRKIITEKIKKKIKMILKM